MSAVTPNRKNKERKGVDCKHGQTAVPSEASEFLRLIARILRRRTGKQEVAEGQSQNPDIEDQPGEEQG